MSIDVSPNITPYITPYKLNKPVLTGSGKPGTFDALAVDCPFVFYHQDMFYMLYAGFDGIGYQTGLAVSNDLLNWQSKAVVLKREEHVGWDKVGAAGTWILKDTNGIYDVPKLKKYDGKYWMVYHSYPEQGYEEGAAQIGLAWTEDENLLDWHRLKEPVYSWKGGADWEKGGLYKACLIEHDSMFYMYYNAKNNEYGSWVEQTGVVTSKDLLQWKRYEGNPVLKISQSGWDSKFCSDPYVLRHENKWLMFFFGFDGKHAQDGIAVSEDFLDWDKYPDPILSYGTEGELDEIHTHKPSIVYHNGVLYHFYCTCRRYSDGDSVKNMGVEFRCISVAASKPVFKP